MESKTLFGIPYVFEVISTRGGGLRSLGVKILKVLILRISLMEGPAHASCSISVGVFGLEVTISALSYS